MSELADPVLENLSTNISLQETEAPEELPEVSKSAYAVAIANIVLKKAYYLTLRDTEEIFIYDPKTGIYKPNGITYLKENIAKIMRNKYDTSIANEAINYIKTQTYTNRAQLVSAPNTLTVNNGVLDLTTRTLQPLSPKNLTLNRLPVDYISTATCPNFLRFLKQVMTQQEIDLLQEYVGYCLRRGYPYKKALLIVGPPNTGKTTLLKVLIIFLDSENTASVSLHDLEERFYIAELFGKMANICDELSPADMKSTSMFKGLTGNSQLKAEMKFKNPFHFTNEAKLIFATNKTPKAPDPIDSAFFERWQIIEMTRQFTGANQDPHLLDKLTTPTELSGILNWALDGLDRLEARGRFLDLPSFLDVQAEFGCLDSVGMFVRDKVVFDPSAVVAKETLNGSYVHYCKGKGYPAISYVEFCQRISQLKGVTQTRTGGSSRTQSFRGIRI